MNHVSTHSNYKRAHHVILISNITKKFLGEFYFNRPGISQLRFSKKLTGFSNIVEHLQKGKEYSFRLFFFNGLDLMLLPSELSKGGEEGTDGGGGEKANSTSFHFSKRYPSGHHVRAQTLRQILAWR